MRAWPIISARTRTMARIMFQSVVLCAQCTVPGPRTWAFVEKLFVELATLFPDEYIHLGGDEADYCSQHDKAWKRSNEKSGAAFMATLAKIAGKSKKKSIIWDDTFGSDLLGVDVAVQWWHSPTELSALLNNNDPNSRTQLLRSHRYYLNENLPAQWSYIDPSAGLKDPSRSLGGEAALCKYSPFYSV